LGPVQAWAEGRPLDLGERKQRMVLAVLLVEPSQLVLLDRLVDLLWREEPPNSARRIVQAHVSRLRTAFLQAGDGAVALVRRGPGYMLSCDPEQIDAHRFRALLDLAWRSADTDKVSLLRQALALWRGPALADVATGSVRAELCRGLEEARLAAVEELFEAELRLGRDGQLVGELSDLVARNPYHQRLVGLLMLALYRAGRSADALGVFASTRRRLDEELGLEPSTQLKQLQLAMLRSDPSLNGQIPAE